MITQRGLSSVKGDTASKSFQVSKPTVGIEEKGEFLAAAMDQDSIGQTHREGKGSELLAAWGICLLPSHSLCR